MSFNLECQLKKSCPVSPGQAIGNCESVGRRSPARRWKVGARPRPKGPKKEGQVAGEVVEMLS